MRSTHLITLVACLFVGASIAGSLYVGFVLYKRSLIAQHTLTPNTNGPANSQLLIVGDSRVSQWHQTDELSARYLGFPGGTSSQVLNVARSEKAHLFCAPTVVIQLGINDIKIVGLDPKKANWVVQDTSRNLLGLARIAASCSDSVILQTVIQPNAPGFPRSLIWSDQIRLSISQINQNLVAGDLPANAITAEVEGIFLGDPPRFYADALHFTSAAYTLLNKNIKETKNRALQ